MQKSFFRKLTKKFFIIANILVAILFLTGCYVSWFNPVTYWYLGLLTLSSFYLLAILLFFFIFWIFLRSRWSLVFIICFIAAFKPIQRIIPFRLSTNFDIQKQPNAIRILDWNVAQFEVMEYKEHPELKHQMLELINDFQPDIACFQEMTCDDSVKQKTYKYHLNEFKDSLGMQYDFYSYNSYEDFYPDVHFGIMILSKYPIVNKKMFSYPPHDYNSIFQYADILKDRDTIRVFNIHLQSIKLTPDNLHYIDSLTLKTEVDMKKSRTVISKLKKGFLRRQEQADSIKAEIDRSPYPFIVCGDFNDLPNSYTLTTIGDGLRNTFVEKGHGLGRTYSGIAPTLRIDNIFTDKHFSTLQYLRIKKKLSDHFPIVADIVLE